MSNNFILTPESLQALTDSLSKFEKYISATFSASLREQSETAQQMLLGRVQLLADSIKSMLSDTLNSHNVTEKLSVLLKEYLSKSLIPAGGIPTHLEGIDFSQMLDGITVSSDFVELSPEALDNASELAEQLNPSASLSKQMNYKEFFFKVLYPLFLMLFPIIFSLYQQKQSEATENEKIQLLQEQNDLLSEIVKQNSESDDTLNEILYWIKSLQDNLPVSEELPETAPDSVSEAP